MLVYTRFETGQRAWRQRQHLSPSGVSWRGQWASTWPTSWCSITCCWCLDDQPRRSSPTERAVACDFASLQEMVPWTPTGLRVAWDSLPKIRLMGTM